jgi:hypothetical protein
MLELVKAIVEPIAKSLSITDFIELRKKKKAHEIGTELFLLYASLNDILVVGRRIVEDLESAASWMKRKLQEGKPDERCSTGMDFLLRQQSLNILKLVASVKRLGLELQVIAPDVYVRLSPLMHGKLNAVSRLIDAISGECGSPRLVSVEAERVQGLLNQAQASVSTAEDADLKDRVRVAARSVRGEADELANLFIDEPIDDVRSIPAKQYPVVQTFLKERKHGAELDKIETVLTVLREAIEKNFSLRDILLNVGDRRSTLGDPYVGF